jgi:hypothetical protein
MITERFGIAYGVSMLLWRLTSIILKNEAPRLAATGLPDVGVAVAAIARGWSASSCRYFVSTAPSAERAAALGGGNRGGFGRPFSLWATRYDNIHEGIVSPALATAVLALSACASYPPASSPSLAQIFAPDQVVTESVKVEREAFSKVYSSCLARAAKRLDDYKSDPTSIARGMMSACKAEFDELVDIHSRHLEDLELKQKVAQTLRDTNLAAAVQLVLTNRKGALTR